MRRPHDPLSLIAGRIALLWAGVSIGVAFLATPAKFLAPSLSLPVALDVGRQTFRVTNRLELAFCVLVVGLSLAAAHRGRWALAFATPAVIVLAQALWLIPVLDARVGQILAGHTPPPSHLHLAYIALEGAKALWLLVLGFSSWPWRLAQASGLGRVLTGTSQIISLHGLR